jgi:hypothetical protein
VTFKIAYKAMNDRTKVTSDMAIEHRLSCCHGDVKRYEDHKQTLSLGVKTYYKLTLQYVAHNALSQFVYTHLYYHLQQPTSVNSRHP